MRKEDYHKYAVGVYKENLPVSNITIEISNLCFHFLNHKPVITGTRHRKVGLVVQAKFVFLTDDRRCCETLENQLRRNIFPTIHVKLKKKVHIENFRFTK